MKPTPAIVILLLAISVVQIITPTPAPAKVTVAVIAQKSDSTPIEGLVIKLDEILKETGEDGVAEFDRVDDGDHALQIDSPYEVSGMSRYTFMKWSDGSIDNPRAITVIEDTNFAAILNASHKLRTQVVPENLSVGLTVEPSSPDSFYMDGTTVNLTAPINVDNMYFYMWTINGLRRSMGEREVSVKVDQPTIAIALYRESYEHLMDSKKMAVRISIPAYQELMVAVFAIVSLGIILLGLARNPPIRRADRQGFGLPFKRPRMIAVPLK